jgi:RNA polymerase sigma-70 factor (ECF subfamily)
MTAHVRLEPMELSAMAEPVETQSAPSAGEDRAADRVRALIDEHYEFVWRQLRSFGVPAATLDDETQRVFWLASRKIEAIAGGSERAFLFRLAAGAAANVRRSLRRRREVPDDDALEAHEDEAPGPEEMASRGQARRLLDAILAELPADLRVVFVLFELEELDMAEIAACLQIPTGTVASRLRRAREKFHVELARLKSDPKWGVSR